MTPLITASGVLIQKRYDEIVLYYRIWIDKIKRNFLVKLKKILYIGFRATLNFQTWSRLWNLFYPFFSKKPRQKLRLIMHVKIW